MRTKYRKIIRPAIALAVLLISVAVSSAQEDPVPKTRLRSPASVGGHIGGESHDSYVIRARRGRKMTVQLSWRREGDNRAEMTVSDSANFFEGGSVNFGKTSADGRRWDGRIPRTGDYYIYVVAHPEARYRLRVKVR